MPARRSATSRWTMPKRGGPSGRRLSARDDSPEGLADPGRDSLLGSVGCVEPTNAVSEELPAARRIAREPFEDLIGDRCADHTRNVRERVTELQRASLRSR